MRKIILLMSLLVTLGCDKADKTMDGWVEVGNLEQGVAYANPSTIRKDGDKVKMWSIDDFKTVHEIGNIEPFMSIKVQNEYDCKEEQFRMLANSFYSANMGREKAVYNDYEPSRWKPVTPGSMIEKLFKLACGIT